MSRDEAIATLRIHQEALRQRVGLHAAVFGSVARDEEGVGSDIDILVELDPARDIDVFAYAGLKRLIGELFAQPVDVVNAPALKDGIAWSVRRDAAYAF